MQAEIVGTKMWGQARNSVDLQQKELKNRRDGPEGARSDVVRTEGKTRSRSGEK